MFVMLCWLYVLFYVVLCSMYLCVFVHHVC